MFVCMRLQEWKDEKSCVRGRGLRIFFHSISVQMMDFAKDVVQLLSTRFQVGFYSVGWNEKDSCGQANCVRTRWIIWKHVV